MSPTAAMNAAAVIAPTPGTLISRRISSEASASDATSFSIAAISDSQNSIWRIALSTDSRSATGSSSSPSHRRPALPKRSLKPGLGTSRLITAVEAGGEELEALGVHRHPGAGADLTSLGDRDLHEVAVDVDADRSHLSSFVAVGGEAVDKRHRRIRARSPTGRGAGAAIEKPGSKPIAQIGLSSLRLSTKAPCPSGPNLGPGSDNQLSVGSFMPRKGAASLLLQPIEATAQI